MAGNGNQEEIPKANDVAKGEIRFFNSDKEPIKELFISKSLGIVAENGTIMKFRVEVEAHNFHGTPQFPNRQEGYCKDTFITRPDLSPSASSNSGGSCTAQIFNLNNFAVHMDNKVTVVAFPPNFYLQKKSSVLASGGSITLKSINKQTLSQESLDKVKQLPLVSFTFEITKIDQENPKADMRMKICKLFNDQTTSDFKVTCQDQTFHVHKFVLSLWSECLSQMFSTEGTKEHDSNELVINDFDSNTVEAFLRFLYTETVSPKDVNADLLSLADKYMVDRLFRMCENHLALFGFSNDYEVIRLAIVGHQVNSLRLMSAAWSSLFKLGTKSTKLAQSWALVCQERPKLSIAMSQMIVEYKPDIIPSSIFSTGVSLI